MRIGRNWRKSLELFAYFFRIGWYTFGGGWGIIAQIQKEYVEEKGELTEADLLDMVSVGRSLPGTMIGNVAYLFGYRQCGILGGLCSVLGIILPATLLIGVLTFCYTAVQGNLWVIRAMEGVRAVVVPIILSAALKLNKSAFPRKSCILLALISFTLSLWLRFNSALIVFISAAAGLLLFRGGEQP